MSHPHSLRETTVAEVEAMTRYLLGSGRACPASVVQTLEEAQRGGTPAMTAVVAAHTHLAKLVAPATPATIRMMDPADPGRWSTMGTVKLVRQMMWVAIGCMTAFVGLSLFRSVGAVEVDLAHSAGGRLLLNELFWMASAGLGASFAMLFQVSQFITDRTYDPAYAPSYWIKLLLGVIAGFILVVFVAPEPAPAAAAAVAGAPEATQSFTRPLLALLGGFSASAVYGILTRLVEAVENLFAGSAREQVAQREAAAVQRASGEAAQARIAVAGKLVQVQQQLAIGGAPEELASRLQAVIDTLVGGDAAGDAPAAPSTAEAPAAPATAPEEARVPALAVVGDGGGEEHGPAQG
jgi:hypothetical protein